MHSGQHLEKGQMEKVSISFPNIFYRALAFQGIISIPCSKLRDLKPSYFLTCEKKHGPPFSMWAPAKTSDILEQLHQDIDTWHYHETLRNDRGDTKNDDFWYTCLADFVTNVKSLGTMRDTRKTMTISATSFRGCNRFSPLLMYVCCGPKCLPPRNPDEHWGLTRCHVQYLGWLWGIPVSDVKVKIRKCCVPIFLVFTYAPHPPQKKKKKKLENSRMRLFSSWLDFCLIRILLIFLTLDDVCFFFEVRLLGGKVHVVDSPSCSFRMRRLRGISWRPLTRIAIFFGDGLKTWARAKSECLEMPPILGGNQISCKGCW